MTEEIEMNKLEMDQHDLKRGTVSEQSRKELGISRSSIAHSLIRNSSKCQGIIRSFRATLVCPKGEVGPILLIRTRYRRNSIWYELSAAKSVHNMTDETLYEYLKGLGEKFAYERDVVYDIMVLATNIAQNGHYISAIPTTHLTDFVKKVFTIKPRKLYLLVGRTDSKGTLSFELNVEIGLQQPAVATTTRGFQGWNLQTATDFVLQAVQAVGAWKGGERTESK
jgi:hypothetical protein